METFIAVFFVFCLLAAVLYSFMMIMLITGWLSLDSDGDGSSSEPPANLRISILIPARNEEHTIERCITSIASQQYDMGKVEIIVIDDHSDDSTSMIAAQALQLSNVSMKLLKLSGSTKSGKKAAVTEGVNAASGHLLITTDADTVRSPLWLASIAGFYNKHKPKMIIGPVAYSNENGWFEKMQSVEFSGLVATAGGAAGIGMSMMCNGANLAFEKEAFEAAGGYSGNESIASGDDVMLMSRISRLFPGSIKFLKSKEAIVYTQACSDPGQFLNQRIRWASKNRAGYSGASLAAGIIVLCMNFAVPAALILAVFFRELAAFALFLLGLKCIIDFLFLFLAASFFQKRRFLFLFIPQQLLYMLYINLTGMLAIFSGYEWKGRKHR